MTQYINKSAVVAEIKRRKELVSEPILSGNDLMIGERNAYFNLLSFIDTLEVKEMDLEKEIIRVSKNEYFDFTDCKSIARHLYELCLNALKGYNE